MKALKPYKTIYPKHHPNIQSKKIKNEFQLTESMCKGLNTRAAEEDSSCGFEPCDHETRSRE